MTRLTAYTINAKPDCPHTLFAAQVLSEELHARTGLSFPQAPYAESGIRLSVNPSAAPAPEGYVYHAENGTVSITGYDRLGLFHGIGRFLREAAWSSGAVEVADCHLSTYPKKKFRGAQIGYRSKTNAYSAWSKATYAQYIRELALFGANAVEFLPPRTDDQLSAPIMRYNPLDMLQFTSEVAHSYGLLVWLWYPNMSENPSPYKIPRSGLIEESTPEADAFNAMLRAEDEQRIHDFSTIPHIDHILIPAADPGALQPDDLFAMSGRAADILHTFHPNAGVWVSAQVMSSTDAFKLRFYEQVAKRPAWLSGICHAPWVSHTMQECRARTPLDLPIRAYPDICHMMTCEYPVHGWDPIWAVTAGRECYNPRPRWHRRAHDQVKDCNIGSIAYTEGIADDVAKFIWLDADWDDAIPVQKTLRDFANMFISPQHAGAFAALLARFEDIWEGPAVANRAVFSVYRDLRALEARLRAEIYEPGFGADSYRFTMPLLMSAFCLHVQRRAVRDQAVYAAVFDGLDAAKNADDFAAQIRMRLSAVEQSPDPALYDEIWALADTCWEKIQWKLSTSKHHSPDYERGAFLDTLAMPLCNAPWLLARLHALSTLPDNAAKLVYLKHLRDRNTAGPGGKYICFGTPEALRYLRMPKTWWEEPEALTIPRVEQYGFVWSPVDNAENRADADKAVLERVSSALGYYHAPVVFDIDGLQPGGQYTLRLVYPLRFGWKGQPDIPTAPAVHGMRLPCRGVLPDDPWVYCYDLPTDAVGVDGVLTLSIEKDDGPRGSGVTEMWLILQN